MYEKLPDKIKTDALCCLWRYEERNGKRTKVPYRLNGSCANSTDRRSFTDFQHIKSAASEYDGIGMGVFDGFCAVDIEHCVTDGKLSDRAQDIVDTMDSYTEYSPSGTGVRIIFLASGLSYDKSRYYINHQKMGLEVYVAGYTNKFVALTGNAIYERGVEERSAALMTVLEQYMVKPIKNTPRLGSVPGSFLSDDSVVSKSILGL